MKDLQGLVSELKYGRISRRQFLYRALAMGLSVPAAGTILAACGSSSSTSSGGSASPVAMDTTKPSKLYLYNWADYIAPATVKNFKKQTGITIVESYFDDNESLLARLKAGAGGYDLIVPSDYMVHIMWMSGLLEPLYMKYIPNFVNVMPKFQHPAFDPGKGTPDSPKYSVPWQWGTTGIGYRKDKVNPAPTKWANLFPPQADPWKGQIDMLNDERETPGVALQMLGYSINSTDQNQLNQATQALIQQKPLVRQYDSVNMKRNLSAGVPLVHTWYGDALLAMHYAGKNKVGYDLPEEGFTIWVDNLCIPKGAPSPYAAHLFMNFVLDPMNAAELVDYIWYLSPVVGMTELLPKIDKTSGQFLADHIPTDAELQRGETMNDVGAFARNYTDAWAKVKSS
jgi:spermidine/putrescine transport system substrate-binding protein